MFDDLFLNGPTFGPRSWGALLAWVLMLSAGVYLYNVWQERNPARRRFLRRLGLGLSILSGLGLILLALKATPLAYASWPIWSYLVAIATLSYLLWAAWYYVSRLPRQQQALAQVSKGRSGSGARTYPTNGRRATEASEPPPPRPVATTGRREARRDKKRKSR